MYISGDATDPANYRPISTLSSFRKGFEKLIYNQLYNFLEKYSILYKYQFEFRKGYSTEQAMGKKLVTYGLFLDFSKPFDPINHILLSKLLLSSEIIYMFKVLYYTVILMNHFDLIYWFII